MDWLLLQNLCPHISLIYLITEMTKLFKNKGFSILEMLIYISILVLLLGVIMSITVSVVRSQRSVKAAKSIENSAIMSMERIDREVRQTDNINGTSSILDSSPGKLVLESIDSSGNPRTIEFYLSSGTIYMKENDVVLGAISQTDAVVTSLAFHLLTNLNARGIKTEMTIESGTSTYYRSGNFYSSVTLR